MIDQSMPAPGTRRQVQNAEQALIAASSSLLPGTDSLAASRHPFDFVQGRRLATLTTLVLILLLTGCGTIPGLESIALQTATLEVREAEALPTTPAPTITPIPVIERLVFSSERNGNRDIFLINADGSGLTQITVDTADDYAPAWSPNRRQIVFVSERSEQPNIYLIEADGSNLRRISNEPEGATEPAWSPDGTSIVYVAGANSSTPSLKIADLTEDTDTTRTLLTTVPGIANPAWKPDGTQIAFSAFDTTADRNREIFLTTIDQAGPLTNLTNHPANDNEPAWSPDGTRIAFQSDRNGNNDIYTMYAIGTGQTRLTDHAASDTHPTWSLNGSRIVFSSTRAGGADLFTMTDSGLDQTQLTVHPTYEGEPAHPPPLAAPINDQILVIRGNTSANRNLAIITIESGSTQALTDDLIFDNTTPAWSPDGTRIAYAGDQTGNYEIVVRAFGEDAPVNITSHPTRDLHPVWSPDGTRIAFESNRGGQWDVYIINADGSGESVNLSQHPSDDGNPTWSPDGSQIAFASNRDGDFDIYVVDLLGIAEPENITGTSSNDVFPAWSPDGRLIAFRSDRTGDNEIFVMTANGAQIRRISFHPANDTSPSWSPDSRRLVFASNRSETIVSSGNIQTKSDYDIYVVNISSLEIQRLTQQTTNENYPVWRPTP
jgi:Tol biopolymer transport system component